MANSTASPPRTGTGTGGGDNTLPSLKDAVRFSSDGGRFKSDFAPPPPPQPQQQPLDYASEDYVSRSESDSPYANTRKLTRTFRRPTLTTRTPLSPCTVPRTCSSSETRTETTATRCTTRAAAAAAATCNTQPIAVSRHPALASGTPPRRSTKTRTSATRTVLRSGGLPISPVPRPETRPRASTATTTLTLCRLRSHHPHHLNTRTTNRSTCNLRTRITNRSRTLTAERISTPPTRVPRQQRCHTSSCRLTTTNLLRAVPRMSNIRRGARSLRLHVPERPNRRGRARLLLSVSTRRTAPSSATANNNSTTKSRPIRRRRLFSNHRVVAQSHHPPLLHPGPVLHHRLPSPSALPLRLSPPVDATRPISVS